MAIGWGAAIAAGALIMGLIAKSAGNALSTSSSFKQVITRLGARGAGAEAYLGFAFLIVAVLIALVAAGQVAAARNEEGDGRLDHLLVRRVARWSWLSSRLGVTTALLVGCGLIAGLFAWLGTESQSSGLSLTTLIEAGLNLVPRRSSSSVSDGSAKGSGPGGPRW